MNMNFKEKIQQQILTNREEQVLLMLNNNMKYYEVAHNLSISIETVRRHAYNTYRKLAVKNKTQALFQYYTLTNTTKI